MSLFGLLLCGIGLGYAVHKDNQKFANMKREAIQLYGRGINEHFDGESLTNKYFSNFFAIILTQKQKLFLF